MTHVSWLAIVEIDDAKDAADEKHRLNGNQKELDGKKLKRLRS